MKLFSKKKRKENKINSNSIGIAYQRGEVFSYDTKQFEPLPKNITVRETYKDGIKSSVSLNFEQTVEKIF